MASAEEVDIEAGTLAFPGAPEAKQDEDVQASILKTSTAPAQAAAAVESADAWWQDKGFVSNLITFAVGVIGALLLLFGCDSLGCKLVLSAGLFGFAGGITNWLAVKLLFDRVPFLYGSGVIPNRFEAIRVAVKDAVMTSFFDTEHMSTYIESHLPPLLEDLRIGERLEAELAKPEVDELLSKKMNEVIAKGDQTAQVLMMASMAMGGVEAMVPHIKPLLASFAKDMSDAFAKNMVASAAEAIDVSKIRGVVDDLMTDKLRELTPAKVKSLMETVIRKHLGWLVVWGNVFGALIGVVSQLAGFGL